MRYVILSIKRLLYCIVEVSHHHIDGVEEFEVAVVGHMQSLIIRRQYFLKQAEKCNNRPPVNNRLLKFKMSVNFLTCLGHRRHKERR